MYSDNSSTERRVTFSFVTTSVSSEIALPVTACWDPRMKLI